MPHLQCGSYSFDLNRPLVMGIVNITPDSFSDGGQHASAEAAVRHAYRLIEEGADILDMGAESSRPGAPPLPLAEELARLLPVLHALRGCGVPVSVDTYKPETMRAALNEGAAMVNDIYGFRLPGAIEAVVASDCGLCVMHMQRDPLTMQLAPEYGDVVQEVAEFLAARVAEMEGAGITRSRIVLDPGFGFGKTVEQNYHLLARLQSFTSLALPILAGLSRKSMLGAATGRNVDQRLPASLAAALAAVSRGAAIVRVHDVRETVDALKIWRQIECTQA